MPTIRVHVVSHDLTRHVLTAFTRVSDDTSDDALAAVAPDLIAAESSVGTVHVPRSELVLRAVLTGDDVLLSPATHVVKDTLDQLVQPSDAPTINTLTATKLEVTAKVAGKKAWVVIENQATGERHIEEGITDNNKKLEAGLTLGPGTFACMVLVEDHQPAWRKLP